MKNIILTVLLASGMLASAQQRKFEVRGRINGWKQKEQVMLIYPVDGKPVFDTTDVAGGRFSFKGQLSEPVSATIALISGKGNGPRDNRTFFIDKGVVALDGTDSIKNAQIKGNKLTMEGEELQAQLHPLLERLATVRMKGMSLSKEMKDGPELKALEEVYRALLKSLMDSQKAFISKYPGSYVSLTTVKSMIGNPLDYQSVAPVYALLTPQMKASPLGRQIAKELEVAKNTSIGAMMPDFTSLDTLRRPLGLYDVVKKGKLTLVDFWASWCKPCREENPNVVKAFNAFHGRGLNILSVSLDQNEASWKKAIAMDGMPWYHVSGLKYWNEPVALQLGITGVPDNFLLDAEGKVLARGLRGKALYQKIEDLLTIPDGETEAERRLRMKGYINVKDSVSAAIEREPTALGKEKIIRDFFNGPVGSLSFLSSYQQIMLSELSVAYAAENNVKASERYLNDIKSPYMKAEMSRKAAVAYAKAGNQALAIKILKPVLDSLLQADGTIRKDDLSNYTHTAQAYMEVLKPGSAQEVIRYLKPLYEAVGKFFPTDISAKTSYEDVRKKLFYHYAKALPGTSAGREIAEIINRAFQNGAVPAGLQERVVKDFAYVPNLQKYLAQYGKAGKQQFEESIHKLFAKTDINGKVWGAEAFKGKYVLIDFWGSWCLPCRFTHPHLKEVYHKYKDKGLEIVGVALESSPELEKAMLTWKKAVKEDELPWIQVLINDGVKSFDPVKVLGIGVFPTKILLDREGNELARYTGIDSGEFDQKMKVLFGF